jgi:hypothetical protein
MLAIKVLALPESMAIQGVVPFDLGNTQPADELQNLLTIEQTWASLFRCSYSYTEGTRYKLAYI